MTFIHSPEHEFEAQRVPAVDSGAAGAEHDAAAFPDDAGLLPLLDALRLRLPLHHGGRGGHAHRARPPRPVRQELRVLESLSLHVLQR